MKLIIDSTPFWTEKVRKLLFNFYFKKRKLSLKKRRLFAKNALTWRMLVIITKSEKSVSIQLHRFNTKFFLFVIDFWKKVFFSLFIHIFWLCCGDNNCHTFHNVTQNHQTFSGFLRKDSHTLFTMLFSCGLWLPSSNLPFNFFFLTILEFFTQNSS